MEYLNYEKSEGVITITLNRPEVYNALNDELTFELQDAFRQIKKDSEARVVVLTGAGKAFCSGQDLKSTTGEIRSFKESLYKRYNPIIKAMRSLSLPIICRLNGVAAGAGCSIALACDIIVADEQAKLTEVFINIGLVPDSGSSYFLPRLVGSALAFELASTGRKVGGAEAAQIGLVNKAVPTDKLDETVNQYVSYYKNAPTKAIGLIKDLLNKSGNNSLDDMLQMEAYYQEIAGRTEDYKEGVTAFSEKRPPKFKGR